MSPFGAARCSAVASLDNRTFSTWARGREGQRAKRWEYRRTSNTYISACISGAGRFVSKRPRDGPDVRSARRLGADIDWGGVGERRHVSRDRSRGVGLRLPRIAKLQLSQLANGSDERCQNVLLALPSQGRGSSDIFYIFHYRDNCITAERRGREVGGAKHELCVWPFEASGQRWRIDRRRTIVEMYATFDRIHSAEWIRACHKATGPCPAGICRADSIDEMPLRYHNPSSPSFSPVS